MTLTATALVLAVLAQIALTFVAMVRAGRARFRAYAQGRVTGDIAVSQKGWPPDVMKLVNNMNNQFETPTIFYALSILGLVVQAAGVAFVALAWAYVASRIVHAVIHTGSNDVLVRFRAFLAGLIALVGMTGLLAVDVVLKAVA